MVAGVVQHPVFSAAQVQAPQGTAHNAAAYLSGGYERIAGSQAPDAVAHQSGEKTDACGHHRERKRHHQLLTRLEVQRLQARIRQEYGLLAAAVTPGKEIDAVSRLDSVEYIAQVPGQYGLVGPGPGDTVDAYTGGGLEAAQSRLRGSAELTVGIQLTVAGPVQGQLQKLHGRAAAPVSQKPHMFASL